jgi:hypothetical protein
LPQELIDQRGFAMINVSDDRDVAKIGSGHKDRRRVEGGGLYGPRSL